MINLQQLEAQIDRLIASETEETLTNWLIDHRMLNLRKRMGNGNFEPLDICYNKRLRLTSVDRVNFASQNTLVDLQELPVSQGNTIYAMAA